MYKIDRKITIFICGSLILLTVYFSYYYDNIFAVFIYPILAIPFLVSLVKDIYSSRKEYIKVHSFKIFYSSLFGILCLVSISCIVFYFENKKNVPTLLKANNHGVYADFKTNGTYVLRSGSWGSKKHYYGRYILKDSLITIIDRKNFNDILTTDKFLILKIQDPYKQDNSGQENLKTYLVQIDNKGLQVHNRVSYTNTFEEFYSPHYFEVIKDNR